MEHQDRIAGVVRAQEARMHDQDCYCEEPKPLDHGLMDDLVTWRNSVPVAEERIA